MNGGAAPVAADAFGPANMAVIIRKNIARMSAANGSIGGHVSNGRLLEVEFSPDSPLKQTPS